jgi:alanyl-tRNA synthetase
MSKTAKIIGCRAISKAFLALHQRDGFKILVASSLLHPSVNTSFVMSAGLVQIENELDEIVAQTGGKFTFTQPCFRYFDMALVGKDSTHSSLFHMPAAFYIGSKQRDNILPRLWHFLTHCLQLKAENLWISYLNDPILGLDQPTYACWKALGINEKKLIGLNRHHNFWRQRQLGQIASDGKKCGPHSEVFYERPEISCPQCEKSPALALVNNCNCGRFVEISNSLFIENYINEQGQLIAADTVFSECVIGAERLAMILQAAPNVHRIAKYAHWHHLLHTHLPIKQSPKYNQSIDIIVDHLAAFIRLVEEGAPEPGRGGRARIMRNLARGAITQALLWDINLNNILTLLLSKYVNTQSEYGSTESLQRLQNEVSRFNRTLERAKKQMVKMLKNAVLTKEIKIELQQKWGLPPVLSEKFYKMLSIKV